MTVIGFSVISPSRAIAWADTEIFGAANAPTGHKVKLAVNVLAGVAMVSTGFSALSREAADGLGQCRSLDEALDKLPKAMRRAAADFARVAAPAFAERSPIASQRHGLVGYSHRLGRVAGFLLDGRQDYEPSLRHEFLSPAVVDHNGISCIHSVIAAAAAQLFELQRELPGATGGVLTLAEIGPEALRAGPIFEFSPGRLMRRPLNHSAFAEE